MALTAGVVFEVGHDEMVTSCHARDIGLARRLEARGPDLAAPPLRLAEHRQARVCSAGPRSTCGRFVAFLALSDIAVRHDCASVLT